jgi:hypothetical protein
MRPIVLLPALAVLAACGSMTEPYNRIIGYAPEDGECRIDIVDRETQKVVHSEPVRGKFSAGYGLDKDSPKRVDVLAICGGKVTKALRRVTPGSLGVTDLGSVGP